MRKNSLIITAATTAILTTLLPATGEGGTTKWGMRETEGHASDLRLAQAKPAQGSDTNRGNTQSPDKGSNPQARDSERGNAPQADSKVEFHIDAPQLARALIQLTEQSGLQLIYPAGDKITELPAKPLNGQYTTEAALKVLLKDTGLEYEFIDARTIAISDPRANVHEIVSEVVVTARRREERLQDVPMSVLAVSGEALESANVNALNELFRIVPGLVLTEGAAGGTAAAISLRGLGTFAFAMGAIDPTISTAVDGVVSGFMGGGALTNFSDIERIEVLRGPQGTLFGKNSSGGVINIVTKDPASKFSADASADYSPTYRRINVHGAITGPIVEDELAFRLSAFAYDRGGYVENLYDGRMVGDDNQVGVRGKLLFTPSDTTRIELTGATLSRDRPDASEQNLVRSTDDSSFVLLREFNSDLASPTNDRTRAVGHSEYEDRINDISLQWDQELGNFTLTSISAYSSWAYDQNPDRQLPLNEVPVPWVVRNTHAFDQNQFTQELRLASPAGERIEYIAGLYYFTQDFKRRQDALLDLAQLDVPGTYIGFHVDDQIATENYAGFGELNFNITDQMTLIAGGRWTREEKNLDHRTLPLVPLVEGATVVAIGPSGYPDTVDEVSASRSTWRVGGRWTPNPNHTLYATVATGFKGPAFNINISSQIPNALLGVDPEKSMSYELGWKGNLLDHRLGMALALFHTELEDFQAQGREIITTDEGLLLGFDVLKNAGKVQSSGVELELNARPIDRLLVNVNAAYMNARYEQYVNAPCYGGQTAEQGCVDGLQDLSGERLARAPKWSANTSAQYQIPIAGMPFDGLLLVNHSWRSKINWSFEGAPNSTEGSVGLVGASVGITDKDGRYSLLAYGENLTNKFHTDGITGGASAGTHTILPGYKRVWGIKCSSRF